MESTQQLVAALGFALFMLAVIHYLSRRSRKDFESIGPPLIMFAIQLLSLIFTILFGGANAPLNDVLKTLLIMVNTVVFVFVFIVSARYVWTIPLASIAIYVLTMLTILFELL